MEFYLIEKNNKAIKIVRKNQKGGYPPPPSQNGDEFAFNKSHICRNIFGDDAACGDHRIFTNHNARQNHRCRADAGSFFNNNVFAFKIGIFGARVFVVAKTNIRTDKNTVFQMHAIPQLHAAFNRDVVADDHIVFNKTMCANIAICTNFCACQNHAKLPNICAFADMLRLHICKRMNHFLLKLFKNRIIRLIV